MKTEAQRFAAKVKHHKGHWIWTGSSDGSYGKFWKDGKLQAANRIALEAHTGQAVPKTKKVIRTCSTKNCVNPDHHFVGTQAEARSMSTLREKNNKLDIVLAAEIRDQIEAGHTTRELAADYEVSQSTIWKISIGRTYQRAETLQKRLKAQKRRIT